MRGAASRGDGVRMCSTSIQADAKKEDVRGIISDGAGNPTTDHKYGQRREQDHASYAPGDKRLLSRIARRALMRKKASTVTITRLLPRWDRLPFPAGDFQHRLIKQRSVIERKMAIQISQTANRRVFGGPPDNSHPVVSIIVKRGVAGGMIGSPDA